MARCYSFGVFRGVGCKVLVLAFVIGVSAGGGSALAGERINKTFFGDVAIEGYDPVAYFVEAKAMKGSDEFSFKWSGANWYFTSAKHRDLFAANPEKFAPQYGGFCANAASVGREDPVDPRAWTIWQGNLYLSYSKKHSQRFASNPAKYVEKADAKRK